MRVMVTGAEEHQGLAVIRGLGLRGIPVVACGAKRTSLGFASKFAVERHTYTSPYADRSRFADDIVAIARHSKAGLIMPAVESTLVVLDEYRTAVEAVSRLAAPSSHTLALALDKLATLQLAQQVDVPVPRTAYAETSADLLHQAAQLAFPVALKPRGHPLYRRTANALGFKVRYASTIDDLRQILGSLRAGAQLPLVQEYAPGVGVCVSAVCHSGAPVALFPYLRVREFPRTGGVSVVRRSLPLDERLGEYVSRLLRASQWHGIAMVEFRHDPRTQRYVLMEINGRFQASTALSIDAGLNLPYLVYAVYTDQPLTPPFSYEVGVEERWLYGDLLSLGQYLAGETQKSGLPQGNGPWPSRAAGLLEFLMSFRPGMNYDEFKWYDCRPGFTACRQLGSGVLDLAKRLLRR